MGHERGGTLIYGGSFNPMHIGHLRLAIEARERLKSFVRRIDFVPARSHPWKDDAGLLPFDLRVRLIRAAAERLPDAFCNELEGLREGPSYTVDTLREYSKKYDKPDLFFLAGSEDYRQMAEWRGGLGIIEHCNIAVAPRGAFSVSDFIKVSEGFWPGVLEDRKAGESLGPGGGFCLRTANGSRLFYLSIPWLDISASRVRRLWLNSESIDYLLPWAEIELLNKHKTEARERWL